MNNGIKIFVYGTLRYKELHWKKLNLAVNSEYLGTYGINGYTMFDIGECPGIIPSLSMSKVVTGDVLKIINPRVSNVIDKLALDNGFEIHVKKIGDIHLTKLYVIGREENIPLCMSYPEIESGDWVEYNKKLILIK